MNPLFPANDQAVYKDAIFFSGHKFVGGIQTPGLTNNLNTYVPYNTYGCLIKRFMECAGILVAKKKLFKNKTPNGSGGGAVFFVSRKDHKYLKVSNDFRMYMHITNNI